MQLIYRELALAIKYRAITNPALPKVALALLIAAHVTTAALLWIGSWKLVG